MKKVFIGSMLLLTIGFASTAQDTSKTHAFTMEEYEKGKTLKIKDLDNDTYVKFDNTYVLDRYEGRKPYFITGDDGKKKRIDLYRYLLREGRQELGTIIYYTNESGTQYQACLPSFKSNPKIWEKYFEDIHAIDKQEPNFVLKLSYVLSKEFSFQLYKAANQGKDLSREAGTYGTDICFPGSMEVDMANGTKKHLSEIRAGDEILSIDPNNGQTISTRVKALVAHEAKNYAITTLTLLHATESQTVKGNFIELSLRQIQATPNHPVLSARGEMKMGEVKEGDFILCDEGNKTYKKYIVWNIAEQAGGKQQVFNIEAEKGSTYIMNGVMMLQKSLSPAGSQ